MAVASRHTVASVLRCGALAVLSACLGCGQPTSIRPPITATVNTPKGQLDWAMERLNRALDQFGPGGADGLKIRRNMTHELFPPNDTSPQYTARVTIESTTIFRPLRPTQKTKEELNGRRDRQVTPRKQNPLISDPAAPPDLDGPSADPLAELQDFAGAVKDKLLTVDARVEPRKQVDTQVYELVYQDERWQLTETPETEYEQLLFEYALEN